MGIFGPELYTRDLFAAPGERLAMVFAAGVGGCCWRAAKEVAVGEEVGLGGVGLHDVF